MQKDRRILSVTSNFPRWVGDSTTPFVLHLAEDLQALGWQVDVLAPHAPGSREREVINEISVNRFRYFWPQKWETLCYQGGALSNLKLDYRNYFKLPALIFFQWQAILNRLNQGNYGLLHSHWILPQGFTGALAAAQLKIPHIITVHGSDAFALQGNLMRGFKRFSLHRADAVTVNSSATSNQVMSIAPTIPEPTLIPMGISTNEPDPRRSAALRSNYRQGNGPLLVFVGRLVEGKGVDDLLYALVKLKLGLPDVSALIVGDGPERSRLEQATIRLNIHDKVFFAGWIETADVSSYLAAADIFIGPSRLAADGAIEAQGLTFLEAMFAGLPVIATDLGGIKDIVIHEKTGLLVADRSPNEIAQGVIRLTQNTRLRDALVTQARALSKQFTRESTASKFSRLFEQHTAKGIE